jgi:hypothetical protein
MLIRLCAYLPPVVLLIWAWSLPDRWRSGSTQVTFRERLINIAIWWIFALFAWFLWRLIRRLSRRSPEAARGFEVIQSHTDGDAAAK